MPIRNAFYIAILSLVLIGAAGASQVNITEPYQVIVSNGSSTYFGKVGPGQTFFVNISSSAQTPSGKYVNIGWNEFVVKSAPPGWIIENSSLNTRILSVLIKPAPDTPSGIYRLELQAINIGNYSGLGTLTMYGYVNVTPDVFRLNVSPSVVRVSPGTPAKISVTINNTGVSDNPFEINMTGLPAWNVTDTVIALHHTSDRFVYTVYEDIPGVYHTELHVSSLTSPIVNSEVNTTIIVSSSLENDYYAIGDGAVTFPIIYEPAYDVMYIIGYIAKHV